MSNLTASGKCRRKGQWNVREKLPIQTAKRYAHHILHMSACTVRKMQMDSGALTMNCPPFSAVATSSCVLLLATLRARARARARATPRARDPPLARVDVYVLPILYCTDHHLLPLCRVQILPKSKVASCNGTCTVYSLRSCSLV